MSLDRLLEVMPPPAARTPEAHDWHEVENALGSGLPSDYKSLVELYGPGSFGDFIHVYQPNAPWEQIDLVHEAAGELGALQYLRDEGVDIPYRLDEPSELLAFGRDENGNSLFWQRKNPDTPDAWNVIVKEARGDEWFTFAGGVADFLTAVFLRKVRVPIFPDDFPSAQPEFQPYI